MGEYTLQIMASLKIAWVAVGSLLYGLGGISNKWIRRFILPIWMGLGLWVFGIWTGSFIVWQLLYVPLFSLSLHIGYGGTDDFFTKVRKRAIYGLCLGISAFPIGFISHSWILFSIHLALCTTSSVLLGVFNTTKSARDEESLIATLSMLLVLLLQ